MITRLEICKLALKELVRQRYEESLLVDTPRLSRLQKDIQYVSGRIKELEREYEETCKIDM